MKIDVQNLDDIAAGFTQSENGPERYATAHHDNGIGDI